MEDGVRIYRRQQEIRAYLKAHDLVAFVADGSVLPRKGDSDLPLDPSSAVPFVSPPSLAHTVTFSDGEEMRGMGIPRGVTVITGAGFSGKTTLLDAVESGIYDHIPGDGREYVIADPGTLTVNAEDGRYVGNADLSPFFHAIPGQDVHDFTTKHASGSVSQAANIVEAAEAGARLLLIDEDRSAANFMLRDAEMRLVVPDEIIIPFTDRILELKNRGISVLLVIGGSGEYLKHADRVILVEEYRARDITESVRHIAGEATPAKLPTACWSDSRTLLPPPVTSEGIRLRSFHTEKLKKVALNEYSSDITDLSAIVSDDQIHTLAYIIEQILTDAETSTRPLMPLISEKIAALFPSLATEDTRFGAAQYREWFLDEVRATEVYCCLTRMRGFAFRAAESRSKQKKAEARKLPPDPSPPERLRLCRFFRLVGDDIPAQVDDLPVAPALLKLPHLVLELIRAHLRSARDHLGDVAVGRVEHGVQHDPAARHRLFHHRRLPRLHLPAAEQIPRPVREVRVLLELRGHIREQFFVPDLRSDGREVFAAHRHVPVHLREHLHGDRVRVGRGLSIVHDPHSHTVGFTEISAPLFCPDSARICRTAAWNFSRAAAYGSFGFAYVKKPSQKRHAELRALPDHDFHGSLRYFVVR